MDQLVCFWGASASVYKGAKGEGGRRPRERGAGGVLLLPGVGLPSNPIPTRIPQVGKREKGGRPPLLVLIGLGEGGRRAALVGSPFTFPLRPMKAHMAPGGFR